MGGLAVIDNGLAGGNPPPIPFILNRPPKSVHPEHTPIPFILNSVEG